MTAQGAFDQFFQRFPLVVGEIQALEQRVQTAAGPRATRKIEHAATDGAADHRFGFSKPYYRSQSIWLAQATSRPGTHGITVGAVRGSAQARHVESEGWKSLFVEHHRELPALLAAGTVDAVLVPMPTALQLLQDKALQGRNIGPSVLPAPQLSGDVAFSISPQRPDLQARIDAAIDAVKSDGRFDRINTKYLPFRLQ